MPEADALERQERTILNTVPTPATATDARGVERIVEPSPGPWQAAPVEPDPAEVARLARIGGVLEEKKQTRLDIYRSGTTGTDGTGADVAKAALEGESNFGDAGGYAEGSGTVEGRAEDTHLSPGAVRNEQGQSSVERLEDAETTPEGDGEKGDGEKAEPAFAPKGRKR